MLGQGETIKDFQHRFPWLFYSICLVFFLLGIRLVFLQVYKGDFYRRFSDQNSLHKDKIPGPRGLVFDRNYRLLVDNRLQLDVTVTPQFVKNPKEVIAKLAEIAGDTSDRMMARYVEKSRAAPKFQSITIIDNAPWPVVAKIESSKEGLSGVEVETHIRRSYLQSSTGAHLFGYLSEVTKKDLEIMNKAGQEYELGDSIGRAGLERRWEKYLRGQDGVRFVVVNSHGHRVQQSVQQDTGLGSLRRDLPPQSGNNIVLTIDSDLQEAASHAMKGMMGAAVALDPRTGEVLTMLSNPSYDPTELSSHVAELWPSFMKNPWGPLRNKAMQDHFPPGSTFKIFTALAGLEAGLVDENSSVTCTGSYKFGNHPFRCWLQRGHGYVDIHKAIVESCDVFFYQLSVKLGIDRLAKTAMDFGFSRKSGIDLYGEEPGLIPTEAWKMKTFKEPWSPGETLSVAIGQGADVVTPLQLANAYAVLVNGGTLYRPYVVQRIENQQGEIIARFGPEALGTHHVSAKHVELVKQALYDVANDPKGTAYRATHTKEGLISGKTGTAQVMGFASNDNRKCEALPFERRHHGWFVGYAPRDNPEIAVAVMAMHECHGASAAAPVVRAIIDKWWAKKQAEEALKGPQPAAR